MAGIGSFGKSVSSGQVTKSSISLGSGTSIKEFKGSAAGEDGRIAATDVIDFETGVDANVITPEKFEKAVGIKPVSKALGILSSIGGFFEEVYATAAVVTTTITSGVLDLGEHILDGVVWVGATVGTAFGADTTGMREFIARDLVDEANQAFYENTELGQLINEKSALKYDSNLAQGIRHGTEKVAVFAAATAATVCTGGAAAVALPLVLGFAYGAGEKAEQTYQEHGTDVDLKQELGIAIAGVGSAASWYAQGKLGEGAVGLVKVAAKNGLGATGSALIGQVKSSLINIKNNGVLNTLKGIVGKEQLLANLKTSLLSADNISDSIGIIGDNVAGWINGDQEFNFKTASYAFGELIATMGLNVLFDSASDYIGALDDIKGISIESVDDAVRNMPVGGDYVEETALFGGSQEKKGFMARIFGGGDVPPASALSTQERILRDRINDTIRQYGTAQVTFNNTTEFSANLLRNIDDLSSVQVRINGGFNDLNGNFRPKYNAQRYIDRITYTGYETLAIMDKLDELQSMIDMNLPTVDRAYQIYEVLASEIPVMHDFEYIPDGHKISASLRGLTDVNSAGKPGLVCAGYSQAYKELCTRCGITCDYIRGTAYMDMLRQGAPGGHAWNVILDGDTPIPVDVTWRACGDDGWFGGSDKFQARHVANPDEWFQDYSAPKTTFDTIAEALRNHDAKYGAGSGLKGLERYLSDGNPNNITSAGGARSAISGISMEELQNYVVRERTKQNIDYVMDVMTNKYGSSNAAWAQITAFVTPGNPNYGNINLFTSTGGARDVMRGIDFSLIQEYVKSR